MGGSSFRVFNGEIGGQPVEKDHCNLETRVTKSAERHELPFNPTEEQLDEILRFYYLFVCP